MSYLRRYGRNGRAGLGDAVATLASAATDPYLSETICRVGQLSAIDNRQPVPPCATTPGNRAGGVGLRKVMPALRAYVYAEQRPWVYPVAAVGVIGIPMLLGYLLGKGAS